MKKKKYRIPRKQKKKIPKDTPYCYTSDFKMIYPEDGSLPYYKIKCCPYFESTGKIEGHCKLLNCGVLDQTKSCGLKYGKLWK